jgi:hypothetical protein
VHLQDLVNTAAAICNVLEKVELLLLSPRSDEQSIEQEPFLEVNVFNRASLNPMIPQTEHSLCNKDQTVVRNLKITD